MINNTDKSVNDGFSDTPNTSHVNTVNANMSNKDVNNPDSLGLEDNNVGTADSNPMKTGYNNGNDAHINVNDGSETVASTVSADKNGIISFEPDMPVNHSEGAVSNDDASSPIHVNDNDNDIADDSDDYSDVSPVVRAWVKTTVWLRMIPSRYKAWSSDDNPDRVDRDRMLSFALTPIVIGFVSSFFTLLVSYSALGLYMLFMHSSYDDAITPVENFFNSYLGIPVAILGMGVVMFSPVIREMVKANGGYHISLRSENLKKDMKTDSTMKAWLTVLIVGIFGGMVVWIIHTVIINVLFNMGIDVTGSSSTTARVTGESTADAGVIGWTGVLTAFNVMFSMIISPVLEELVYRGFVARCLIRSSFLTIKHGSRKGTRNWWRMIIVCILSGLWFGAGHITTQDGFAKSVFLFVFMTLFAALLAWLSCVKFDSLWPAILIHIVYNGITLLVAFGIIGGGDAGVMSTAFSMIM